MKIEFKKGIKKIESITTGSVYKIKSKKNGHEGIVFINNFSEIITFEDEDSFAYIWSKGDFFDHYEVLEEISPDSIKIIVEK